MIKRTVTIPKYRQIAIDIAYKILNNEFKEGDKVYARSTLSSQYAVSSETARKAVCILADLKIVEVLKSSGIKILSKEKANNFINQNSQVENIYDVKRNIIKNINNQQEQFQELNSLLENLISKTINFHSENPFTFYNIRINKSSTIIGKIINEINFWQNTGATIIGIKRENEFIISPGPYAILKENDIIYYVGSEDTIPIVENFINNCNIK